MTNDTPDKPWWDAFFDSPWNDGLRESMKPSDATAAEVRFIRDILRLGKNDKVLDVPCGDGRLGIPLAASGCQVVGVDLQARLIEVANAEAASRKCAFEGRESDMRDLPWFDEFDAALCFWSSFGYFDDEGNREFLEAIWRSLKPGAPFLIDTQSIETVLPGYLEKDWFTAGDWTVLEERQFDCETSRIHGDWIFLADGKRHRRQVSIRMYTCRELCDLLSSCGFGGFEAYDTATGDPFALGASHLALIARKKA